MTPATREQLITTTQAFLKDENICACVRAMAERILKELYGNASLPNHISR
jgi:hypothetical protein